MVLSNGPSLCPVGLRYDQPSVVFSLIITAPKCQTGLRPWKNIWKGLVENWAGQLGVCVGALPGVWPSLAPLGQPPEQRQHREVLGQCQEPGMGPSYVRGGPGSPFLQQLLNGEIGPEPLDVVPENVVLLLQGLLHLLHVHLLCEGQVVDCLGRGRRI